MIGVIYTGENKDVLESELEKISTITRKDTVLFIEPNSEKLFFERVYSDKTFLHQMGYISKYCGYTVTSTQEEQLKRLRAEPKIVTLKEIADKFNVSVEQLRIKE